CEPTKFGENCAEKCSTNCTDQLCHHVNGRCHKCQPGHRGKLCDQFCENKTYGQDCMTNCSTNCTDQSCRPVNGSCISCHPGYLGDVCDKVCDAGFYGQNCLSNCSLFCNTSSECEPQTGTCYDGCKDGYSGDDCKNKCQDRTYGRNCTKLCSAQCKTKSSVTCHHVSGECLTECEEDYSGQYCENKESSVASSKVGAIVGSIVAIIILAVLATVGAIIWKRKLQRKPQDKNEEVMHLDNIRERAEQETAGDSTYINVAGILINTKIAVEVLNKYIDSHTGDFFTEQYKKVPKPKNVSTEVAVSDENKNKNRYKNICPYDHSRVHLKINTNKSEGDYINASYVRDSHNDVKFIAAQGPFGAVVNDFVRMLWEQKVEKVVMLTNLIEEGKPKCDKYWPDSGNTAFGEITVKLKDTQILADYVIRKIELEKSDAPTQILTHYHFTSWPDQGVPVTPWALVDFEQRVDINSSTAPVIVHCSAGVGRTGTFIALHNVLSQAKETGSVDFYKTLVKLREDRFLMIQTPDQYIFLHKAAQAAIVSMGTTVIFNDSKTRMQHLLTKSISGMSNMEKEFQNICAICQNESNPKTNSEAIYQNTENVKVVDTKNRFESIIPKNCYRPYLGSDSKEFDDYINAVFVQGFYKKDQQILTQLPMPSTLIDFFRLVTQHRVSLIVAFEVDKRSTDQTIANYLPSQDKPITASPFSIRSMGIKGDNMWEEHTIKVINENTKAEHDVIHWKCKVLDPDARRLLSLVNKSRSYNAHANGRIIYTCRDGATYSGLACVLSLLLDRIDHDTCLAIPLVVGSVKSIRPQVISTFEHYVMLHEALQSYNDTTAAYTNMEENFFPRFSSLKNKDLDESQAKEGNVYSNM
ncbi:receptor-type tyrosine-protein phosphatase epsilon, partial [Biomphalaria glabrata]